MEVVNDEVELVDVEKLEPHPKNPNEGNIDSIRASIRENGWYGYIVVQRSRNRILAGEHSWRAARLEGFEEIPVVFVDVDDETALRILLADNETAAKAERDQDLVDEILDDLADTETGLQGTGYGVDDEIVEDVLGQLNGEQESEQDELDVDRDDTFRPVLDVEDIRVLERAIQETGIENRGEAITHICKEFLGENAETNDLIDDII